MANVAFLGLGVMGYPMAGNLLKKGGHDVTAQVIEQILDAADRQIKTKKRR